MIMAVDSVTIGLTVAPSTTTTAHGNCSRNASAPGAEIAEDLRPAADRAGYGAKGSISWMISEASPSYSLAGATDTVPSPAWKMTMAAIRVVARLKAKA
ncbi:hypothetical protein DAH51_23805 [Sphingobium yanoikuyae]|uniref:Uncharacterized protein n=1 Tax=Sphingobium yanoikuyae TaxID=13690 RepID=A0A430BFU8_SPHYA|nr:hypothetical protein DAH51_23805 [Sphingobium yanoikuyae]